MCVYTPCEVLHNIVNNNNNTPKNFAGKVNASLIEQLTFEDTDFADFTEPLKYLFLKL